MKITYVCDACGMEPTFNVLGGPPLEGIRHTVKCTGKIWVKKSVEYLR